MKQPILIARFFKWVAPFFILVVSGSVTLQAQQLKITDFVLFGGSTQSGAPNQYSAGVDIGTNSNIQGGSVGSPVIIKTKGSLKASANLFSGGVIQLSNYNAITGQLSAANSKGLTGTIFSAGNSTKIIGNIDVNGNIVIKEGTISGKVTHPSGTTYSGPAPSGGNITGDPSLPVLPAMPAITNFPSAGSSNIYSTQTITPGAYGNINLYGNKTLTLSGTGIYVFKSIKNSGGLNSFVFDFKNSLSGAIKIFIQGDADLYKVNASLKNGGSASRIYTEVHGTGYSCYDRKSSFNIASGSSGINTKWLGTVWAPYGAINIGSGLCNGDITGALWSATHVTLESNIALIFAPFREENNSSIFPYYPPPENGKTNELLGPELSSLAENPTLTDSARNIFVIENGTVLMEIISLKGTTAQLQALLQTPAYGLTDIIDNGPNSLIISGRFPIANLEKLNSLDSLINYCRPLFPPLGNSGVTTTSGDSAIHSDFVRNGYNVSGKGVKVAVISDSYNALPGNPAQTNVLNGDLPGAGNLEDTIPVDLVKDYRLGTDEGRAMLQIVHDIAPKAQLGFRTGFISAGDFAQGIRDLKQKNYNVIVDDITYITEPFFQDGIVAQAVNDVTAQGVTYVAAAGNYANASYQSTFKPVAAPAGITGSAHDFGGGDILQSITLRPGAYTIVLQWQDSIYSIGQTQTGTQNDLDIYLAGDDGSMLFGFNKNNLKGDPIEILPFTVTATTNANLMIIRAAGNSALNFKYIIFRGDATINEHNAGQSTIVGQANSAGAITVGAVRYTNTPEFGVATPIPEDFSSIGGTPVNGVVRNKPDVTGPDGVNTTVNFGSKNIEGDKFPNFFGTSAAAPHIAGVAALLLESKVKFDSLVLTPGEMKSLLQTSALHTGAPGFDFANGAGFAQAQQALATFAAPTPVITDLVLPDSSIKPGKTAFTLTVKGNYFNDQTKVYFRGSELATMVIGSTQLTAQIPVFDGNPPIQALTKPISVNGNDGGFSAAKYFSDTVKKKITITADDKSKRFGEKIPPFTATVLVDGVPLANSGLTLQDLGLDKISYICQATDFSNVDIYLITPVRIFDPANPADKPFLELYSYGFKNGLLSIDKLPLKITPDDKTITYGNNVKGITFGYEYPDVNIAATNKALFHDSLVAEHKSQFVDTAIAFVNGKAIVAGRTLTAADLQTMSFLASGKAIVAGKVIVAGADVHDTLQVVEINPASIFNYQVDSASAVLINGKAIVGGKAIVAGKAIVGGKAIVAGTQLVNSANVSDTTNSNVVVIVDAADVSAPEGESLSDLKSINLVTGLTAGTSYIVPGAFISGNFAITYGLGKLTILPAKLTVKADNKVIAWGSHLPEFTSTIKGFVSDQDSILSGPKYSLSPACTGFPGVYTITPSALVLNNADNYSIDYLTGQLYINPRCFWTRNIELQLDCVEALAAPVSGFSYVAHFSYSNCNATPVYIPLGNDNYLTSAGSYSGTPPQLFAPNGGKFDVYFDGKKLTWVVKSYCGCFKVPSSANASSTSGSCSNGAVTFMPSANDRISYSGKNELEDKIAINKITAYPNPVKDKVVINTNSTSVLGNEVVVSDILGRIYNPRSFKKISSNSIELDLSGFNSGVYLVKLKIDNSFTIFRIVKL